MQKKYLFMFLPLLVLILAGTSYAWQGRMGGMGDPYGLFSDESDFLIHPAKVVQGEGIRFYGDYRFTYTGVTSWDYNLDQYTPAGVLANYFQYNGSGQEYRHNALVGAVFPLGSGRMGAFFTYDGLRGDYDGNEDILGTDNFAEYDLTKDFDNFALRLLYGLPLGGSFNAGGEVQFAYRQEKQENWIQNVGLTYGYLNVLFGGLWPDANLLPLQFPYDSNYWEALLKGSLEGMIGPLDLEFTLRGGFIFGGDNNLVIDWQIPVGTSSRFADLDGDVQGWQIGGDLWARYLLGDGFTLPFLVRIDYQTKTKNGDGPGTLIWSPWNVSYDSEEEDFRIEAGGGVDKELGTGTRIAGGVYYTYLQGENDITILYVPGIFFFDHDGYPTSTEHRVSLRFAGEHDLTASVALRMGLVFFYGWVQENFDHSNRDALQSDDISLNGSHWGIEASVGGTLQFGNFTMEPFINGGWQQIDLSGDGYTTSVGFMGPLGMDLSRNEWYIGGGCSFLYDIP